MDLVSEASSSTCFPETAPVGRLVVVSGPSGVGKTSVVGRLREVVPLRFSVSATTRDPRPGEVDGIDYRFVDDDTFDKMRDAGELVEWAEYNGHSYGSIRAVVQHDLDAGHDIVLDIENHGAHQIKAAVPGAILIFVAPPSFDVLEARLRSRGDTSSEEIDGRLAVARSQLEDAYATYDHVVVNDDLDDAVAVIAGILSRAGSVPALSTAPPSQETEVHDD